MTTANAALNDLPHSRAVARSLRITPMKARRVVDLIRNKTAADAASILAFAPQAAAEAVGKLLASAVANAEHNHGLDPESLFVATAFVDEGSTLKRFQPRAQGRAFRINKRTCHITLELVSVQTAASTASAGRRRGQAGSNSGTTGRKAR